MKKRVILCLLCIGILNCEAAESKDNYAEYYKMGNPSTYGNTAEILKKQQNEQSAQKVKWDREYEEKEKAWRNGSYKPNNTPTTGYSR